jgi:hypothetical protein
MDGEVPVPGSGTGQPAPGAESPMDAEGLASSADNDQRPEVGPSQRTSRRMVVGVVLVLVVVAAGIGLAFALSGMPTTISTGTGSATITWTPVSSSNSDNFKSPPQPFEGTIEGIMASGVATMPLTAGGSPATSSPGALPTKLEVALWQGTFGGKPFKVGIFADYSSNESIANPSPTFPTVTIVGRWGTEAVKGKVDPPSAAELKNDNGPLRFTGTVGQFKVSGTVQSPTGRKTRQSQVSLTVTR